MDPHPWLIYLLAATGLSLSPGPNGLLALTHVSARFSVSEVAEEARALFPQTVVPRDFDLLEVPLPERGPPVLVPRGGRRGPREDVGSPA